MPGEIVVRETLVQFFELFRAGRPLAEPRQRHPRVVQGVRDIVVIRGILLEDQVEFAKGVVVIGL